MIVAPSMFFLRASPIPVLEEYRVSSKSATAKRTGVTNRVSEAKAVRYFKKKKDQEMLLTLPKMRESKGEDDSRPDLLQESMSGKRSSNAKERERERERDVEEVLWRI